MLQAVPLFYRLAHDETEMIFTTSMSCITVDDFSAGRRRSSIEELLYTSGTIHNIYTFPRDPTGESSDGDKSTLY